MDFGSCPNTFHLLCTVLLCCQLSFGLCPGKWDPVAPESCRDLSCTQFPAVILQESSAVGQLMVFTSPWDVKVIPAVEPDGKRQMEIEVHVLAALRDVFMEAHTH